ncbi:patatin-like phospholipase family protein [Variovorax sp. LT1R16]|uniref:patatin-like phospholipase family protein n=1 Tax=Variovorax sp. LT1R16 TaxID=3443728 RepID=UPI003F482BBE
MKAERALKLNLALQGGSAHGAFTWGVLDRLLEEPDIEIDRISGTSAGALNGAALATGYARDGRAGARESLALLWQQVAVAGLPFTMLLLPLKKPSWGVWDDAMPLISPYVANPLGLGPLRAILGTLIDVDALRNGHGPRLYVNAVSAHSGANRVFTPEDMSIDAILASACAPMAFQAVQIGDDAYWDGSYAANPSLWPLHEGQTEADLLMVELTPPQRDEIPMAAKNILNRINEIASLNGLVSELKDLALLNAQGHDIRMHMISLPQEGSALAIEASVKRSVGMALFEALKQSGRAACERWLDEHRSSVGVASSVDVAHRYLTPYAPHRPPPIAPTRSRAR